MFTADLKGDFNFLKKIKTAALRVPKKMADKFTSYTKDEAVSNIRRNFILRNDHTVKSIKAESKPFAARVGSVVDYMRVQEIGGVVRSKTGKHVAIPYPYASNETSYPRRFPVKATNRFNRVRLPNSRFFIRNHKLMRVEGQKKNRRVRAVYDLSRTSVFIKKRPWLEPAVASFRRKLPQFFKSHLLG